jgi:hypothetical protein
VCAANHLPSRHKGNLGVGSSHPCTRVSTALHKLRVEYDPPRGGTVAEGSTHRATTPSPTHNRLALHPPPRTPYHRVTCTTDFVS